MTDTARSCARVGLAAPLAILMLSVSVGTAGWQWLPREQMTRSESPFLGAGTDDGTAGRTPNVRFHQLIRTWEGVPPDGGPNNALGYYVRVLSDWDIATAWDHRDTLTPDPYRMTDLSFAVDASDEVYFAAELFHLEGITADSTRPRIAYRHFDGSDWTDPVIISPDRLTRGADTPTVFLQEADQADTVHVTFRRREGTNDELWYTRKAAAAAETAAAWDSSTFVTSTISAGDVRVDGDGVVHFFGKGRSAAGDSTYLWHLFGPYPGSGNTWDLESIPVATYFVGTLGGSVELDDSPSVLGLESQGGSFEWVWSASWWDNGEPRTEIFFARGDSTGWWSSPERLTALDDRGAYGPRICRSDNGTYHVLYNEPGDPPPLNVYPPTGVHGPTSLYHIFSSDLQTWSRPAEVTPEQRSEVADRPRIVAMGDTLWVIYTSHDDDDSSPPDDDYEVWAKRGYAIADALEADSSAAWQGAVYLDADYVVEEGATLTIAPGTRVFAAASSVAEKVDVIVRGQLIAVGEEGNPIVFSSYGGDGTAGEWGGIGFEVADASGSRLEYLDVRNATIGVKFAVVAPTLRHLTFSGNEVADIFLGQDTRIAAGSEWLLDAPTRVVVFDAFALDDSLGTPGVNDLLVLGSLVTERPPSAAPEDSVVFESVSRDAVNGDDWGGITIVAGGTGVLHDCDIGFGLRGVYFAAANSAELVDSHVHHYSEEGVFDYASDALIQGCRIERGLADTDIHTTAIRASASVPAILDNEIGWQTDFGIWVGFGKAWCQASIPFAVEDFVGIEGNTITGNGGGSDGESSAGIRGEYLCQHHSTVIDHNTVTHWDGPGLDLYESADVHVSCNELDSSYVGTKYSRGEYILQSFEGDVTLSQNSMKRNQASNLLAWKDMVGLVAYDAGGAAGANSFQRQYSAGGSKNVRLDGPPHDLDAQWQSWLDNTGNIITDVSTIKLTNDPGKQQIYVDPPLTEEDLCSAGAAARRRPRAAEVDGEVPHRETFAQVEGKPLPDRWDLVLVGSNPVAGVARMSLAVRSPSPVKITVYDVAGRRIRVLREECLSPGYYDVEWDGEGRDGVRVGAGVYFIRMEANGFQGTRKVVILRSGS